MSRERPGARVVIVEEGKEPRGTDSSHVEYTCSKITPYRSQMPDHKKPSIESL